jgi:hypothetical protein
MTLIFGRTLDYDELNEDDINTQSFPNEDEGKMKQLSLFVSNYIFACFLLDRKDLKAELLDVLNDYDDDDNDNPSFDSYEEKKFHQRSLFDASRPIHTLSVHSRQAIIDILQKALDRGWRPHLKHHIPATRFGRH